MLSRLSMIYREQSRKWVLLSAFLVCLVTGLVTGGLAQGLAGGGQEEEPPNPFADDPEAPDHGRTFFRLGCAFCHGIDARGGGRGPNLTLGRWEHGGSDAALFRTIKRGVPGTEMPPFNRSDDRLWMVISYLRTLEAGSQPPVAGDREAGEKIFFTESNCSQCHMIHGKGGLFGPDLSRIGTSRTADSLVESIREARKNIPDGYKTVTVVTKEGKRITGVRKNEDTFSVQLMSADERLHLFLKKDLQEVREESESLMPSYNRRMLSDQDLENLVAYMSGLRSK